MTMHPANPQISTLLRGKGYDYALVAADMPDPGMLKRIISLEIRK